MRIYIISMETMSPERVIEVLHSTGDGNEALKKLAVFSDEWENSIIEGRCRVLMTTYVE